MGVKREVWTGEAVRQFTHREDFLDGIPDESRHVDNDVIHLVDIGANPDVLINNTTYPIPIQDVDDEDIAISLDKFQTKQTEVTDDDLESASYKIIAERVKGHVESLLESTGDKAAHAMTPQQHTAKTPVLTTTGEANEYGRKALLPKDLNRLKKEMTDAGVPLKGRRLVLSSEHVYDLLNASQAFKDQYYKIAEGKVLNMFGFEIREHANNAKFYLDGDTWKKRGFSEVAQAGDRECSFAFFVKRMFKAKGTTKYYLSEAKNNPGTQANYFNYRQRFIALPKKQEAIAAIVSPDAAQ